MTQGKYARVNGLDLYYEVYGTGKPLVLLHGGLGTIGMFGPVLSSLAETHQVIGVELQAHGHTPDIDRPFSFQQMADDVAALVKQLGFDQADIMGYSLGAAVALQTAFRHPDVVRKLVVVSNPFKSEGWYPENRAGMRAMNAQAAQAMVGSPPHQAYASVAPHPQAWPQLVAKTGPLVGQDYDWSKEVSEIRAPTLLVFGDADAVRPSHIVQFFELLGGGQKDAGWDGSGMPNARLAILPGTTHYNISFSPPLAAAVVPFLDAPMPNTK